MPTTPYSAEKKRMTIGESREYLVQFMKENFTDKTFTRYIMGAGGHNSLAGDFAWQMAAALTRIAALSQQAAPGVAGELLEDGAEKIAAEAFRHAQAGGHIENLYKLPLRSQLRTALASQPHPNVPRERLNPLGIGDTQQEAVGYALSEAELLLTDGRTPVIWIGPIPRGQKLFTHPPEATALAEEVMDKAVEICVEAYPAGEPAGNPEYGKGWNDAAFRHRKAIASIPLPEPRPDALVAMAFMQGADAMNQACRDAARWAGADLKVLDAICDVDETRHAALTPPYAQAALEELERDAKRYRFLRDEGYKSSGPMVGSASMSEPRGPMIVYEPPANNRSSTMVLTGESADKFIDATLNQQNRKD